MSRLGLCHSILLKFGGLKVEFWRMIYWRRTITGNLIENINKSIDLFRNIVYNIDAKTVVIVSSDN